MRFYENPKKTYENREKPRAYYIPKGEAKYTLLNGVWDFAFFVFYFPIFRKIFGYLEKWYYLCTRKE